MGGKEGEPKSGVARFLPLLGQVTDSSILCSRSRGELGSPTRPGAFKEGLAGDWSNEEETRES